MRARYLTCRDCRIRLRSDSPAIAVLGRRCPICGGALTEAASAADVVGLRSFDLRALVERESDDQADPPEFPARRDGAWARDAQGAGRLPDDGVPGAREAAVRLPTPE